MPKLETYKKQAKLLVRWHREGNFSIGGRIRQLARYRTLSDREAMELAIEAQTWARKHAPRRRRTTT